MERRLFEQLPTDATEGEITYTAQGLERYHYEPTLILEAPNFIYWKKGDMLSEWDRLTALPHTASELQQVSSMEPAEVITRQLKMLHYHYTLLCRLREGEAEAWDVIHELYEDD